MLSTALEQLHLIFAQEGTIVLNSGQTPLSISDWDTMERLTSLDCLPFEKVRVGDVGEPENLNVGRLMTDRGEPKLVNENSAQEVLAILGSESMMQFYQTIIGVEKLYIRRCQTHILREGCFIGYHQDTDSNPGYLVAVVLQFSNNYIGGDYIVYNSRTGKQRYRTERHSMLFTRCDLPHEVTKVKEGERKTLVYFLAPSLNRPKPQAAI